MSLKRSTEDDASDAFWWRMKSDLVRRSLRVE